jgi:hypothetical protein
VRRTTRACSLARLAWAGQRTQGARHVHEWSAKIQPSLTGAQLPFIVLFFSCLFFICLVVKSRALSNHDKDLSRYQSASLSVRG